ncbi:MAG: general secretion pathway protein C [Oleiphilaceae bacterium]|jgi:general secretion pathway protein C
MLLSRLPLFSASVLLAAIVSSIYWQMSSILLPELPYSNINQTADNSSPIKTNTKKTHDIAKFKLFGDTNVIATKTVIAQEKLPKTKLKLTLTGVLVSPTDDEAGALILGPDKQTLHYRINDELPGGATLKQVFSDRVILNRSGRLENLYFVEQKSLGIERFVPYEEPEVKQPRQSTTKINSNRGQNSARSQSIKNRLSKLKKRIIKNKQ